MRAILAALLLCLVVAVPAHARRAHATDAFQNDGWTWQDQRRAQWSAPQVQPAWWQRPPETAVPRPRARRATGVSPSHRRADRARHRSRVYHRGKVASKVKNKQAGPAVRRPVEIAPAILSRLDQAQLGICDIAAPARAHREDVDYLLKTATPGYTMRRQGARVALERLNPDFAHRLAEAIRDARGNGLPRVGIFSAYRPPGFGVGGFGNKFYSLHAYGLAVDMCGIGAPGSATAVRWHAIAARHGVIGPYGPYNRAEWNHMQPTFTRLVRLGSALARTITAAGPKVLQAMFDEGRKLIASAEKVAAALGSARTHTAQAHRAKVRRVQAHARVARHPQQRRLARQATHPRRPT